MNALRKKTIDQTSCGFNHFLVSMLQVLNPRRYRAFRVLLAERWWDLINKRFVDEIAERKMPVLLTDYYDDIDEIPGTLGREVRRLIKKHEYELSGRWLLPTK